MMSVSPSIDLLQVDVDENEETAQSAGISAMPTFQAYKGGKKVAECLGANRDKLEKLVTDNQ